MVNVGDVLRVVLEGTNLFGTPWVNVFHYLVGGDPFQQFEDADVGVAIVGALNDFWAALEPRLPDDVQLEAYSVTRPVDDYEVAAGSLTGQGGKLEAALPAGTAARIVGDVNPRRRSGSKFVPAFTELDWENGYWLMAAVNALAGALFHYLKWLTLPDDGNLRPGVLSGIYGFAPFTGFGRVDPRDCYQRRRSHTYG